MMRNHRRATTTTTIITLLLTVLLLQGACSYLSFPPPTRSRSAAWNWGSTRQRRDEKESSRFPTAITRRRRRRRKMIVSRWVPLSGSSSSSSSSASNQQQQPNTAVSAEDEETADREGGGDTDLTSSASSQHQELVQLFLSKLDESLRDNTFVSFSIVNGPSKKQVARRQPNANDETYRGSIRLLTGRLVSLKKQRHRRKSNKKNEQQQQQLIQVTFKYHGATDIAKNWDPSDVASNLAQILLLNDNNNNNNDNNIGDDDEKNEGLVREISSEWGHLTSSSTNIIQPMIQHAQLETTDCTWELDLKEERKKKKPRLVRRRRKQQQQQQQSSINGNSHSSGHDRIKSLPLEQNATFLQALGVTNSDGQPRPGMASKLKQCKKFVEVVSGLINRKIRRNRATTAAGGGATNQTPVTEISIVDHGCGRGYLTFSLHSYLLSQQQQQQQQSYNSNATITTVLTKGIDVRPKLVNEMNAIAERLNYGDTLHFQQGTIQDYLLLEENNEGGEGGDANESNDSQSYSSLTLKVVIALHACDTATDDALWAAISRDDADIIVVAPCCHKQVRPQLDKHYKEEAASGTVNNNPLSGMWKHPIYRERTAEMVTDSIRALLLEIAGYTVQNFEFIDLESTQKNCMITAVKKTNNNNNNEPATKETGLGERDVEDTRQRLRTLAAFHGVREQKLAKWMGESLTMSEEEEEEDNNNSLLLPPPNNKLLYKKGNMPPL